MPLRHCLVTLAALISAIIVLIGGAGNAAATPTPLGSKYVKLVTDDGWKIELRASELVVNPMSNLANAATSREGWISSRVGALISGAGRQPVNAAILEHFLVIGCQIDVTDGTTLGLGLSIGPTVNVHITGNPGVDLGAGATLSPTISTVIKPGRIAEISLGKKALTTNRALVRVKRARVSVDGCLGPTTVRIIARLSVSTPTADDTLNVYSARMWL